MSFNEESELQCGQKACASCIHAGIWGHLHLHGQSCLRRTKHPCHLCITHQRFGITKRFLAESTHAHLRCRSIFGPQGRRTLLSALQK